MMIWRSSITPIARVTASMSALTKFSVTGVRDFKAGREADLAGFGAAGAVSAASNGMADIAQASANIAGFCRIAFRRSNPLRGVMLIQSI